LPHKLSHIELDEISLVDLPANKKKFLFKKAADKDGKGFLICECGHKEALIDFLKSASEECPNCGENLMESATKIMFKGRKIMKKSLSDILVDFIGEDELTDDEVEKFEKAEKKMSSKAIKALKGALNVLKKFKEEFPDDVMESINTLAKYAIFAPPTPAKKKEDLDDEEEEDETEEDLKKAGAKLSKATMELIKSVVEKGKPLDKAIKALAALVQKDAGKSAELLVIEEKMDELTEKLDKALKKKKKTKKEKKEEDEDEDEDETDEEEDEDEEDEETKEAEKEVKKLKKRIKALEEKKGTKKSLKGQDDEDEEDEEEEEEVDEDGKKVKKTKPWSFSLAKTETKE